MPPGVLARLGTVRFRHLGAAALAWSPDGRLLASGGQDATIRIWDAKTGRETRRLTGHAEEVRSVAFAPDGRILASGGEDDTVRLWDAGTGASKGVLKGHTGDLWCVAFSPDGRILASCGDDATILLWDVAARKAVRVLRGHDNWVSVVVFSPDGKRLASGGKDCSLRLWDPASGEARHVIRRHAAWVACVAFSPDGSILASGGEDNQIELFDVGTARPIRTLRGHRSRVNAIAFTPDGRRLMSFGSGGEVRAWDVATGTGVERGSVPSGGGIFASAPDGATLVLGGDGKRAFTFWDAKAWRPVVDRRGHAGAVTALAFGPRGRVLASAGRDKRFFVWDPPTGRVRVSGPSGGGSMLAFSPDGGTLAVGSSAGVTFRAADSGEARDILPRQAPLLSLAFSTRGRRMILASVGETARVDDILAPRAGGVVRTGFFTPKLSPDGRLIFLYAGQDDDRVRIVAAADGRQVARLPDGTACWMDPAFSPGGRLLAFGGGEGGVTVVESATGGVVVRLPNDGEPVRRAVFSTDGRILAIQDGYRSVRLASVGTGRLLQALKPDGAGLGDALAFPPHDPTIAVASGDTSILIWDAGPARRALASEAGPAASDPDAAWDDLAGGDAARACRTIQALARAGDRTVPWLAERLASTPAAGDVDAQIRRLLAELDHDDVEVRDRAVRALQAVGDAAGPALRRSLDGPLSAEARLRVEAVLSDVETDAPVPLAPGARLARHRAVWALERIGTPAARAVLERLAEKSPVLRERREAGDAAARMRARR